jgi:lysophospholipase L1-like esterase
MSSFRVCAVLALVAIGDVSTPGSSRAAPPSSKMRVACVGDSITVGAGAENPYPEQLQDLLGKKYVVENFGSNSSTLLAGTVKPYSVTAECAKAVNSDPDIVVIMLGTNDSAPPSWKFSANLERDLKALADKFRTKGRHPKIYVCTPPVCLKGAWGIDETTIQSEVVPKITAAARRLKLELIDVNKSFQGKKAMWSDGVHLNQDGADLVAETVRDKLAPPPK